MLKLMMPLRLLYTNIAQLLMAVRNLVIPFIKAADDAADQKHTGQTYQTPSGESHNVLVDYQKPSDLLKKMQVAMPDDGQGKEGMLELVEKTLKYSVNTWDQGFLDKLYASTTPVGVVSDLVLSVLNTNVRRPFPVRLTCLLTLSSFTSTRFRQL